MIRNSTLLFILVAGVLSLVVFSVKYKVQDLELELTNLQENIKENEDSIHVLNAEWSHMNNPESLKRLAERHLGMKPIQINQLLELFQINERIPERSSKFGGHIINKPEENLFNEKIHTKNTNEVSPKRKTHD